MSEFDPLFTQGGNWVEAMPAYQRSSIDALLHAGKSPEEVAQLWLSTPGFANTVGFGSQRFAAVFYDKLLEEVEKLICDDPTYADDRKRILQHAGGR